MQKVLQTKLQHAKRFIDKINFTQTKTSLQQVLLTKISTQRFPCTKSVSRGEKSICKFHEDENQHPTKFHEKKFGCNIFQEQRISTQQAPLTKINTQQVPWTKSVSRGEKIKVQVSGEKNQHVTSFMSRNKYETSYTNKITTWQVPWTR